MLSDHVSFYYKTTVPLLLLRLTTANALMYVDTCGAKLGRHSSACSLVRRCHFKLTLTRLSWRVVTKYPISTERNRRNRPDEDAVGTNHHFTLQITCALKQMR